MSHSDEHAEHEAHATGDGAHAHAHAHSHSHAGPADFGPRFVIGIALNILIVVLEFVYGIISGSVALIADAGHNLSDVLGLGVAFAAVILSARAPSARFTYGLKGSSILAALFNAVFLLLVVGALSYEAFRRFFEPESIAAGTMMIVAAIGMAINAITAALFASGRKDDLNVRGAFLHMASDAAVSGGVVVAGLLILLTGQLWLDPLMSLIINGVIIAGTWGLLRESLAMSLGAVPAGIISADVRRFLTGMPGVYGAARSAYLVDEHERHLPHRPSSDAGRPSGRRLFDGDRGSPARTLPHRSCDVADRDRRGDDLCARPRRGGLSGGFAVAPAIASPLCRLPRGRKLNRRRLRAHADRFSPLAR